MFLDDCMQARLQWQCLRGTASANATATHDMACTLNDLLSTQAAHARPTDAWKLSATGQGWAPSERYHGNAHSSSSSSSGSRSMGQDMSGHGTGLPNAHLGLVHWTIPEHVDSEEEEDEDGDSGSTSSTSISRSLPTPSPVAEGWEPNSVNMLGATATHQAFGWTMYTSEAARRDQQGGPHIGRVASGVMPDVQLGVERAAGGKAGADSGPSVMEGLLLNAASAHQTAQANLPGAVTVQVGGMSVYR